MKLFTPSWYKKCIIITGITLLGLGSSYGSMQNLYCALGEQETIISPAGKLDESFNPGNGFNNITNKVLVQPDGRILVGGAFTSFNGSTFNRIVRLRQDGSIDGSFNPGNGANASIMTIALQPDGKILIGGLFTTYNGSTFNRIVRLRQDGSIDGSFNPGNGFDGSVNKIIVQPDGMILVAGAFTTYNGSTFNRIVRLKEDGSIDGSFNPGNGANNAISSMTLQSDGHIYIGGVFGAYDSAGRRGIAKIKPTGAVDSTFNPGGGVNGNVYGIVIQPDGRILIGGAFTAYNGTNVRYLARINTNGSLDTSFTQGTNNIVRDIISQSDEKIIVGGEFTSIGGEAHNHISRINADGSVDTSFDGGSEADGRITTIDLQPDGKILIGGYFTEYDGTARNRIARLNTEEVQCIIPTATCGSANLGFTDSFPSSNLCSVGTPFLQQTSILNLTNGTNITTYSWSCAASGSVSALCIGYQIPSVGTGSSCSPYTGNINNYNYTVSFPGNQVGVLLSAPTNTTENNGMILHTTSSGIWLSGGVDPNAYLNINIINLNTTPQYVQYRAVTQNGGGQNVGGAFYGCAANERNANNINNTINFNTFNLGIGGSANLTANDIIEGFIAWSRPNYGFQVKCELCIASAPTIETQTGSCTGLPANAVANTSSIVQFGTNGSWAPSTQYTYSATPSLAMCNFTCAANYVWNGSACVGSAQSSVCTGLPANAVANTVTSVTQTWNGSAWSPSTGFVYNTTPSTTSCRFTCAPNYNRNGSACVAATQSSACSIVTLPANAVANTVTSVTQTWNGWTWMPSTGYEFNLTPSTTSCRFKCNDGYSRDGDECVAFNPVQTVFCGSLTGVVQGTVVNTSTANTCTGGSMINGTVSNVGFGINGCSSAQGCVQWTCGNGNVSENVACMIPYTLNACGGATTFTDPRDGKIYNIVEVNGKCWFKEPLKYEDSDALNFLAQMDPTESHWMNVPGYQGTYCENNSTQTEIDQEVTYNEERAGCLNLNIRDEYYYNDSVIANISDASYNALKIAAPNSLSGTALPADIKALCASSLGVTAAQVVRAGYSSSLTMNCYKTVSNGYPNNQRVSILPTSSAAMKAIKSSSYDEDEFKTNLADFCPTGWRTPLSTDYLDLTFTDRKNLDLRQKLGRDGKYTGNPYADHYLQTQPLFVPDINYLAYREIYDSGSSYYNYFANNGYNIRALQPYSSNDDPWNTTTAEVRCIKESAPVGWNTSSRGSCGNTYCPAPYNYIPSNSGYPSSWRGTCRSSQGVEGPAPTGQRTRTVSCRQGSTIIPDHFCTKVIKPVTSQACAVANPGGGGIQVGG